MTIANQNRPVTVGAKVSLAERVRRYLSSETGAVAAEYGIIVSVAALMMILVAYLSSRGQ